MSLSLYRSSISSASPDFTTDYDFLKKAREVLSNIRHLLSMYLVIARVAQSAR
jgi:hypothetical protein